MKDADDAPPGLAKQRDLIAAANKVEAMLEDFDAPLNIPAEFIALQELNVRNPTR